MSDPALYPPTKVGSVESEADIESELPETESILPQESAPPTIEDAFTDAQLYQMNQDHLASSVPDRPLIAEEAPMEALRAEYENSGSSSNFVAQIDWLMGKGWTHIRRAKGDGDCFYRSLAFAFVLRILNAHSRPSARAHAQSVLLTTTRLLGKPGPSGSGINADGKNPLNGYEWDVMSMFYEGMADVVEGAGEDWVWYEDDTRMARDEAWLTEQFQDPQTSNCITTYLRFVTSATIRASPDDYVYFLTDPENPFREDQISIEDFCSRYVEASGKEADHVQITALSRALSLHVKIAYLDGRGKDAVDFVEFNAPEGKTDVEPIVLLYRPGHYDALVMHSEGAV